MFRIEKKGVYIQFCGSMGSDPEKPGDLIIATESGDFLRLVSGTFEQIGDEGWISFSPGTKAVFIAEYEHGHKKLHLEFYDSRGITPLVISPYSVHHVVHHFVCT